MPRVLGSKMTPGHAAEMVAKRAATRKKNKERTKAMGARPIKDADVPATGSDLLHLPVEKFAKHVNLILTGKREIL